MPVYLAQFASRERVSNFLDKRTPPEDDPAWEQFGFKRASEYGFWAPRLCGVVCAKMVIDSSGLSPLPNIASLTEEAVALGGYKVHDDRGHLVDKGWFYRPLVELAQAYGFQGGVCVDVSTDELCIAVLENKAFIASVHPGVIRGDRDSLPQGASGGHLVVVVGFEWGASGLEGFYIHNPSGRVASTQACAFVSLDRFVTAYAGRGFWLRYGGRTGAHSPTAA